MAGTLPPDQPREYAVLLLPEEAAVVLAAGRCRDCNHLDILRDVCSGACRVPGCMCWCGAPE